jgi:hypothetical protein
LKKIMKLTDWKKRKENQLLRFSHCYHGFIVMYIDLLTTTIAILQINL